jgi:hypothetical protein
MPTPGAQGALETHHIVTLNYGPGPTFSADPLLITVKQGHTISFKLGNGPANGKIRVTFKASDQGRFSTQVFNDGDPDVRITGNVSQTVRTTYHCALLVNGDVVAQSAETGGELELVPGT